MQATQKKIQRVSRPRKPRQTEQQPEVKAEAKSEAQPAAQAVPQADAAQTATGEQPATQEAPQAAAIDAKPVEPSIVKISAARVRRHLVSMILNKEVDAMAAVYKQPLHDYNSAVEALKSDTIDADAKKKAEDTVAALASVADEYTSKVQALAKERVRFSNEAPVVVSIVCDRLVGELFTHAMEACKASGKRIVRDTHINSPGVEKLPLYPLVAPLPSFLAASERLQKADQGAEVRRLRSETIENYIQSLKDSGVTVGRSHKAVKTTYLKAQEQAEPEAAAEDAAGNKTGFKFYIADICSEIVKGSKDSGIRVSSEVRQYLSDLIVELIQRLSSIILLTTEAMGIKTINDAAILKAFELILADGKKPVTEIKLVQELVPDPKRVRAENEAKAAAKKAGQKYQIDTSSIPKVMGWVANRTVTYPGSCYPEVEAHVREKLEAYKALGDEKKDEAV